MLTVLIVDDDAVVLSSLKRLLTAPTIQVVTVDAAERALEWLDAGGVPDLVLSDHQLPGMTGLDLLRVIESRIEGVPRILYTGDAAVADALANGDVAVVVKPAPPEALRREVQRMLSHRHQMPPPW